MSEQDQNKIENLSDPKIIQNLAQRVNELVYRGQTGLAWRLYLDLIKKFEEEENNLTTIQKEEIKHLILRLKFVALPILTDEEVINLFEKELTFVWQKEIFKDEEGYDFDETLKHKLTNVPLWQRNEFKARLRNAMKKNQQKITSQSLLIENNRTKNPSLENWLEDYINVIGTGQIDNLKQTKYLVNSPNTKDLSDQERNTLRQAIRLYEKLKISSETPEGIEDTIPLIDTDGKLKILRNGRLEDVGSLISKLKNKNK